MKFDVPPAQEDGPVEADVEAVRDEATKMLQEQVTILGGIADGLSRMNESLEKQIASLREALFKEQGKVELLREMLKEDVPISEDY